MNKISSYFQSLRTPDPFFNISFVVMMFMMATLPITIYFMWPVAIILMLLWICQWNWREKWENFKANDGIPYGLFLLCIFLIPVFGFINSTNMAIAWRSFECHLWFLFAPLIFLTTSAKLWSKRHINTLLVLFSVSEIALLVFLFARGIYKTHETGDSSFMYNNFFCYKRHHAYVALYSTFVYILIFNYLINDFSKISKLRFFLFCLLELFIAVGVFCVYSRAGILTFLLMHAVWCGYAIYKKRSVWKYMVLLAIFAGGLFTVLVVTSPSNRFTEEAFSFRHRDKTNKTIDPRLIIWQASWDGAIENLPWGVGTGDGNDVVVEKYHENGHWKSRNHSYNAHNQFLFAMLTNGIPGLIIILLFFYAPLGLSIKYKDIMLLSIFLLMTCNCLVECMFDRRAGVDFFAIMISLFILRIHSVSYQNNTLQS